MYARQWKILPFLRFVFKNFVEDDCRQHAAALTYTTLFAVVPFMTVTYAMLSAIPTFQGIGEQLQSFLFQHFVPSTGETVQNYLMEFTQQAQQLTIAGIGILALTAIMMIITIEHAFNAIWQVGEGRKGMSSFLLYWTVLSLGPLLIGAAFMLSSYLFSLPLISSATETLVGEARLLALLPMLLSMLAFTFLYAAVPNCKVPLKHAALSGVIMGVLFELAKTGFTLFVTDFSSHKLIYGAFATVPLFLMWVYLSWVLILFGAELTWAQGAYHPTENQRKIPPLAVVLILLERLFACQQQGQALEAEEANNILGSQQHERQAYLQLLMEVDIIRLTETGDFLLSRDLHHYSLLELIRQLPWPLPEARSLRDLESEHRWAVLLSQHLEAIEQYSADRLQPSLADLFIGRTPAALPQPEPKEPRQKAAQKEKPLQASVRQDKQAIHKS